MYSTKLDERGRLKLPTDFHVYVQSFREKTLFVTSMDRATIRIYPMPIWRQNEEIFKNYHEDPQVAENVAFTAAELGSQAEMDNQFRIPLSAELRQELEIEINQQVRLYHNSGRIEVLSDKEYKARRELAAANPKQDLKKLEAAGLR